MTLKRAVVIIILGYCINNYVPALAQDVQPGQTTEFTPEATGEAPSIPKRATRYKVKHHKVKSSHYQKTYVPKHHHHKQGLVKHSAGLVDRSAKVGVGAGDRAVKTSIGLPKKMFKTLLGH